VVGSTYTAGVWDGGTWTNATARDGIGEGWGAHAKHINHIKTRLGYTGGLTATGQTFGTGEPAFVCGTCHTNTGAHDTGGNTTGRLINFGDSTFKTGGSVTGFDFRLVTSATQTPIYNGASGTSSNGKLKTCSNISCHFQTTPVWSAY
jgi:hypothetical protein